MTKDWWPKMWWIVLFGSAKLQKNLLDNALELDTVKFDQRRAEDGS